MKTHWSPDGIVTGQSRYAEGRREHRTSPPWWDGEVNQGPFLLNGRVIRPTYQSDGLESFVRAHYEDSGYLALEYRLKDIDGYTVQLIDRTEWRPDGTVAHQTRDICEGYGSPYEEREEPPWLWGVEDQTEPTAPKDDKLTPDY